MILSSADILRLLGGSEVVRLSAKLSIVDKKPALSGAEGLFIYIERFPRVDEFQATWSIYIESDGSEPDDIVLAELQRLLPSVKITEGLLTTVTTTDFLSEKTETAPEAPQATTAPVDTNKYEERFQGLVEDIQDRMLLVSSGKAGKDGQDGRDGAKGVDGRDGRDLIATDAELFDLKDVDPSPIPLEKGQVLTWDGEKWTNLYVRTSTTIGGGGTGSTGNESIEKLGDIGDVTLTVPVDGNVLSYQAGEWVNTAAPPADISGSSINQLADVDTATDSPTNGQTLIWDGSNWVPSSDYATSAQGALADTATQPGDNVSTLNNDAGYITAGEVPAAPVTSVNGQTGIVVLDKADVGLGNVDNTSDANKPISTATQAALDLKADLINGVVPNSQLPAIAVTEYLGAAANESAMLALTGQQGDWCIRTDLGSTWVITGPDPTQVSDWVELAHPADAVTSVNGYVGAVNLSASDVGAATAAQGALADSAVQPGDNVSDLVNDAGYITSAEVPEGLTIDDVRLDAETTTFAYDVEGNLESTTGTEVQKSFTYDANGVLQTVTTTSNGTSNTKTFSYDLDGNLSSVTVT